MGSNAPADPYVTNFSATVHSVDGTAVVLDETYFYPEGGGQPPDRGLLDGIVVTDVQKADAGVVHTLEEDPPFEVGDTVDASVDDEFRTYCMRAHTASHLLYGAGRRLLDDLGYGGFGITERKVRVDFTTPTDVTDETLVELERLTNQAVYDSYDVTWEQYSRETALQMDDIAFNAKTEEGVTGDETVRVVTIGADTETWDGEDAWDVAACGGTHVANTREIGPVTLLGRSNPGEGLTRVEFAVGSNGIARRAEESLAARNAASLLDTRVVDLPEMVLSVTNEREELREEVQSLKAKAVEARLADLREETFERDGRTWITGEIGGLGSNELAEEAQRLAGDAADAVVLVDEDAEYMAAATDGDLDANDVVGEATSTFGGGGGGSPTVAQAGGLNARADEVVSLYRE